MFARSGGSKATINALSVFDVQIRGSFSLRTNHIQAITTKAEKSEGFRKLKGELGLVIFRILPRSFCVPGLARVGPAVNSAMQGDDDTQPNTSDQSRYTRDKKQQRHQYADLLLRYLTRSIS